MSTAALARNAPCPCGSGKRYKDCHGGIGDAPPQPDSADSLPREAQVAFALGQATIAHSLLGRAITLAPERAGLLRERACVEMTLGDIAVLDAMPRH